MRASALACLLVLMAGCGKSALEPLPDPRKPCARDSECEDNNECTEDLCTDRFCENLQRENGFFCDDGDLCTFDDICVDGVCTAEVTDCSFLSDFCNVGSCEVGTGNCILTPVMDGTMCDDGLACTTGDQCSMGTCGGAGVDCSMLDGDCTLGECQEAAGGCVATPTNEMGMCTDGLSCTENDTCVLGTCVGSTRDCDDMDSCTFDFCDEAAGGCMNNALGFMPGLEGPPGDLSCTNMVDDDCDGTIDAMDVSCVDCMSNNANCDDMNPCTTDTCSVTACSNTPIDCDDMDPCTSDSCDTGNGMCVNAPLVIDPDSPVGTSADDMVPLDACLTVGTNAQLLVWTDLRDTNGVRVTGATVMIGGGAAMESIGSPGVYWGVLSPNMAAGSEMVQVAVDTCAQMVNLNTQVALVHAAANAKANGTGGCSPVGGNVRVRVTQAEDGMPIAGAHVIVGGGDSTILETDPEGLFMGTSSLASTYDLTDAQGYVEFVDFGDNLDGPIMVTAGADDRVIATVADGNAADLVLALPELHPAVPSTTTYTAGTGSPSFANCSDLDAGFVVPKLDLMTIASFDFRDLLGRSECWDAGNGLVNMGNPMGVPENLWIPPQGVGPLCLLGNIQEKTWTLTLDNTSDTGENERVQMAVASATIQDLLDAFSNNDLGAIMEVISYRGVAFEPDEPVPTMPTTGRNIQGFDDYSHTVTITYAGNPGMPLAPDTDVVAILAGDYDGTNGTGDAFLLSTGVHPFDQAGSSVTIANSDLDIVSAPTGARRYAAIAALYLPPYSGARTVFSDEQLRISTILIRDDGAGNSPIPGDRSVNLTASSFLGQAVLDYDFPRTFNWESAVANGNAPLYSVHELQVGTWEINADVSCGITEALTSYNTQWLVYKPFRADCAGRECFTLPVLPMAFPRSSSSGFNDKSGFDALDADGTSCSCGVNNGACVDPDGTLGRPQRCYAGSGMPGDPYYYQRYVWRPHLYDMELYPGPFDFNDYAFDDLETYITHESTNQDDIVF